MKYPEKQVKYWRQSATSTSLKTVIDYAEWAHRELRLTKEALNEREWSLLDAMERQRNEMGR